MDQSSKGERGSYSKEQAEDVDTEHWFRPFLELQVIIQEIRRCGAASYEQYLQSLCEMCDIYMQAEGHVTMYT